MDAKEKSLLEAARSCDDCVPWLEHCRAECCRAFTFRLDSPGTLNRDENELRIHAQLTTDLRRYLELRGAKIEDDTIVVPMDRCTLSHGLIHVAMPCSALQQDYLCSLHPDRKPKVCSDLTERNAGEGTYWIPASCLFAYKMQAADSSSETDER